MIVRFRRLLAAFFAAAALAGCADSSDANTLMIWHGWGGAELATLKSLIAKFRQMHPGVDVMALQIPHDTLLDKYTRSSAASGGPDILIGDNDWSGKLASAGLVAEIFDDTGHRPRRISPAATNGDATGPVFSLSDEKLFLPRTLAALRVNHRIYAWPESIETVVLYYNKKLIHQPPRTVAQMETMAAGIHLPDGYGLAFNTDFYFFSGYFLGGGGQIFGNPGVVDVDTPAGVGMLGWLDHLASSPGVLGTNDYGKVDSLYKQGKAAMIVNGPWALADYEQALGPDLGLAPLPLLAGDRQPRPWIGVKCLMINANDDARHRQLAESFCRFLDEPASQIALALGCGHIPAVLSVPLPANSPLTVFERQAITGTPKSADPHLAVVWAPMNRAIQEALTHRYPAPQALERTQETIKAQLAEMADNS